MPTVRPGKSIDRNGTAVDIVIEGLSKTYTRAGRAPLEALRETTLRIEPGSFVSLVGPSGCGKSTILKLVAGLLHPTRGTIKVNGEAVTTPYAGMSMVFQKPTLLGWRSVRANISLPVEVAQGKAAARRAEIRQRVDDLIRLVGLSDFADRTPGELSGGMQQRVAIARALCAAPSMLLMDEPFAALDAFTREAINEELLRIWSESSITVLFVTHDISEAVFLSDDVLVMGARPGRVIETVPVGLARPRTAETRRETSFFERVATVREKLEQAL